MTHAAAFASAPITSAGSGNSTRASLPSAVVAAEPSTAARNARRVPGLSIGTGVLQPHNKPLPSQNDVKRRHCTRHAARWVVLLFRVFIGSCDCIAKPKRSLNHSIFSRYHNGYKAYWDGQGIFDLGFYWAGHMPFWAAFAKSCARDFPRLPLVLNAPSGHHHMNVYSKAAGLGCFDLGSTANEGMIKTPPGDIDTSDGRRGDEDHGFWGILVVELTIFASARDCMRWATLTSRS